MRNAPGCFILALAALVLYTGHDRARSDTFVNPIVINHWLDLAKQIRDLGFAGMTRKIQLCHSIEACRRALPAQ